MGMNDRHENPFDMIAEDTAPRGGILTRLRGAPRIVFAVICLLVGLGIAVADELLRDVEREAERAQETAVEDATPLEISRAVIADLEGGIGPAVTMLIEEGLEEARNLGDAMLVIRMNTPGGLDSATRDIIRLILASDVPVMTYVAPSGARAASAGTYILYASHVAVMAPSTNLGAATPVQMGGGGLGGGGEDEDASEDPMTRKVVNDSVAFIRGLAELRGRNADWAEEAVREGASITSSVAIEQNVADYIADDLRAAIDGADGRVVNLPRGSVVLESAGAELVQFEPNFMTRFLGVITNPNVAYILMLIGIYGLIFEFANPGIVFSGVIGAISLILGLFALNLLPVNYAAFALVGLGVALMIAEVFSPSFGIMGIGGAIAFALGSMMIFDGDVPGFELDISVVIAATAVTGLIIFIALTTALRSFRARTVSGDQGLQDETGTVLNWSGKTGEIMIHSERWHAVADEALAPGDSVRVLAREGLNLRVAPMAQAGSDASAPRIRTT